MPMNQHVNRRAFVLGCAACGLTCASAATKSNFFDSDVSSGVDKIGSRLSPWVPGQLDIHHISTGRGNATFIALPDASTLLIDAGAINAGLETSFSPRPDGSRRPGQWVARYVQRRLLEMKRTQLDYLLVSHFHPDHIGDVGDFNPISSGGQYHLTGVSDVAAAIHIDKVIDRAFPNYDYPQTWKTRWAENYFSFIKERSRNNLSVEKIQVGQYDQIHPVGLYKEFANYQIRNLAANGMVWSGIDSQYTKLFPPLETLKLEDYPTENQSSIAIKLCYGPFSYFTGGDLTSYTQDGALPWQDVLGAVSKVAGPVTVSTVDHHGMFDSLSAQVVRDLKPSTWVIPTWHISHPDTLQLERILSLRLYSGARDIFATSVMRENLLANQRLISKLQSTDGHVVVRVFEQGLSYSTVVTSNENELDTVKLVRGPKQVIN